MPYTCYWYLDRRIIYNHLYGTVTLEEAAALEDENFQHFEEGIPPVHIIVDMADVKKLPTSISQLNRMLQRGRPPALGWIVLVGVNPLARLIGSMLCQVARVPFRTFDTLDDAVRFLQETDNTLEAQAVSGKKV
jgi:hypothetical protein